VHFRATVNIKLRNN